MVASLWKLCSLKAKAMPFLFYALSVMKILQWELGLC